MYTVNEKFELAIFNYNKDSFVNILLTFLFTAFIIAAEDFKNRNILGFLFLLGHIIVTIIFIKYIWGLSLKASKSLDFYFSMAFCLTCSFFPFYLIIGYYHDLSISQTGKMLFISLGILNMLVTSRLFHSKRLSYLFFICFVVVMAFIIYLFIVLYGYEAVVTYYNSFDLSYFITIILTSFSITYSKNNYFENYNKAMWENEFKTEKFNSLFKNIITPIVKINTSNYIIEYNDNFIAFFEKLIDCKEDVKGFLDISEEAVEHFKKETKITEEYIQFYQNLCLKNDNIQLSSKISKTGINAMNIFQIDELSINIFYKQLFYLNKIFRHFKTDKTKSYIQSSSIFPPKKNTHNFYSTGKASNLFDIIFSDSNNFDGANKYKKVGNFFIDNQNLNKTTFDMLFRKFNIYGVDIVGILFYDTTIITQIEKEKANSEVESRKQYLSKVSDKFMTPIQVLLLSIENIAKQFKDQNRALPKNFEEIRNLCIYIQTMNQDITSCSRMENGLDVNFKPFKIEKLFNLSKEIIDLLIRNNTTKCYAIKTKLLISSEVPKIINSDVNRLRQVLINLLTNAYKFTLTGEIKIIVKVKESNNLYDQIYVSVIDSGIGIREDYKETLLSQIEEIKDLSNLSIKGNGLGLLISSIIIGRLGTKIEYEAKRPGSNFSFSFFNLKSKEVENNIKSNKFQKLNDLLDSTKDLEFTSKNVTTKVDCFNEHEKFLINNQALKVSSSMEFIKKTESKNFIREINENNLLNNNIEQINVTSDGSDRNDCFDRNKEEFDVDDVSPLQLKTNNLDNFDISQKFTARKSRSAAKMPNLTRPIDKLFEFDDIVFDIYRISKNDSIFKSSSLDKITIPLIYQQKNKYISFFQEISEICYKYQHNEEFLKIYENFKPYLKFFYKTLKATFALKTSNESNESNLNEKASLKRILIVDDNRPILKALKTVTSIAIKDFGLTNKLEIIKAYDGLDALALFKIDHYTSQSISYIISDHNMSMMDGCDFINLVNKYKLGRNIKLYISSTDNEIIKNSNMKNVEFINKPVRKTDIKNLLSNHVV